MSEEGLICYNRGCGKTFDSSKNTADSCVYHPGVPVFHDAYKKWSCCEKKTTDFTEFLSIKGCTKSYHSNVKHPEIPKTERKDEKLNKNEVYTNIPQPIKSKETTERPDINIQMKLLKSTIGSSLKPLLERLQKVIINDANDGNASVIEMGTSCKNGGCRATYCGEKSNNETCIYHSGVPVFHEGMKFWTCCMKRTTDFESFLEQVGCSTGSHLWRKPKNPENVSNCRYDWHQTGSSVVVSVYSKCPMPDLSRVEANPVKLGLSIVFGTEKSVFATEIPLFGVIDVDSSCVSYLGSKVEITLKKGEPMIWNDLKINIKRDISCTFDDGNGTLEQDDNINDITKF